MPGVHAMHPIVASLVLSLRLTAAHAQLLQADSDTLCLRIRAADGQTGDMKSGWLWLCWQPQVWSTKECRPVSRCGNLLGRVMLTAHGCQALLWAHSQILPGRVQLWMGAGLEPFANVVGK